MQIAIISKNHLLKDALEQVPYFQELTLECYDTAQIDYDTFNLIIFDGVAPHSLSNNKITLGFDTQADLRKPFKLGSLVSLITGRLNQQCYKIKNLDFLPQKRLISAKDASVTLTEKEANLILYLIAHHPRGIPKSELLKELWNYSDVAETSTVEVHLSRLKQKLSENNFADFIISKNKNLFIDI